MKTDETMEKYFDLGFKGLAKIYEESPEEIFNLAKDLNISMIDYYCGKFEKIKAYRKSLKEILIDIENVLVENKWKPENVHFYNKNCKNEEFFLAEVTEIDLRDPENGQELLETICNKLAIRKRNEREQG